MLKARLCVRGYEEIQDFRTDSPACSRESIRISLAIVASKGWDINSIDIKRAFLQGKDIERTVFIRPPKEANTTASVWKLNKCVYGLADAPRNWHLSLKNELLTLGCVVSKLDPGVFTFYKGNKLEGILTCFVDDELWGGTPLFKAQVIDKLKSK